MGVIREKTQDKCLATFPRKVCCTNISFCCNADAHSHTHTNTHISTKKKSCWALELREQPCLDRLSKHSLLKYASVKQAHNQHRLKTAFTNSETQLVTQTLFTSCKFFDILPCTYTSLRYSL